MNEEPGNESVSPEDQATIQENPVYFGGFICAIGYGFLLIALISSFGAGGKPVFIGNAAAIATYLAALFVTLAAFMWVNWRVSGSRPATKLADMSDFAFFLLIAAAVVVALAAGYVAYPSESERTAQRFAMEIPLPGQVEVAEGSSEQMWFRDPEKGLANRPKMLGDEAERRTRPKLPDTATLFWEVPSDRGDEGFAKMLIGALLTILFGILYPFIARGGKRPELGFVEKLVVPILTAILFGVGASEQVAAETNEENTKMAAKGLVPVWGLSRAEARVTVLEHGAVPSETDRILRAAVLELDKQIAEIKASDERTRFADADYRTNLIEQLQKTHSQLAGQSADSLARANQLATLLRQDYKATDALRTEAQNFIDKRLKGAEESQSEFRQEFMALKSEQKFEVCKQTRLQLAQAGRLERFHAEYINRDKNKQKRNLGDRIEDFLTGDESDEVKSEALSTPSLQQIMLECRNPTVAPIEQAPQAASTSSTNSG